MKIPSSDRIHKTLDDKADKKSILKFEKGIDVNLDEIKVGDQLYYLYKAEEDDELLSWYWGMSLLIYMLIEQIWSQFHVLIFLSNCKQFDVFTKCKTNKHKHKNKHTKHK